MTSIETKLDIGAIIYLNEHYGDTVDINDGKSYMNYRENTSKETETISYLKYCYETYMKMEYENLKFYFNRCSDINFSNLSDKELHALVMAIKHKGTEESL